MRGAHPPGSESSDVSRLRSSFFCASVNSSLPFLRLSLRLFFFFGDESALGSGLTLAFMVASMSGELKAKADVVVSTERDGR